VTKLPREFYNRPTLEVAHDVIGTRLVSIRRGIRTSGVIVEVEAYIGESDPACHAAPGPTRRNEPLYGAPGYAYVYLNYGIHALVNLVTEGVGSPAAILIRALEPGEGMAVMRRRRGRPMLGRPLRSTSRAIPDHELCKGPGNLTVSMGITLADNRCDLLGDRLFLEEGDGEQRRLVWSPRIGINVGTEQHWRVYAEGSPAVSGRR
jgi:DNA-3-methyladenine glycosylase